MYMSDQLKRDALGRVILAGGSLTVSTRSWSDHDGTEHRRVNAGEPDQDEFRAVLQHLRRIRLVWLVSINGSGDTEFAVTDLGRAVADGSSDWPIPEGAVAAATSDIGIRAQFEKGD